MFHRDELGFPSFWTLQVAGCVGLYVLVLLSVLPERNPAEFLHQTVFCATVFAISWLLRPICRSLLGHSYPWISLEIRAFGWSVVYGAVATFVSELVKLRYFAGLTTQEAAAILGISTATADRFWAYARAWLQTEITGSLES